MRGFIHFKAVLSLTALALTLPAGVALAQSRDDIISGLRGPLDSASRGIKPAGTPSAQPPAAAPRAAAPVATRPMAPAAPYQPTVHAPTHAAARPPSAPAANPSVNLTVNVPTGSAALTPAVRASLDALGGALTSSELANFHFRIEGHTDTVGSPEDNRRLSDLRAQAVVSYLVNQYRIQPSRLEAVGMGQDSPLVPTPPQTPEPRNRRVQVIKLGA